MIHTTKPRVTRTWLWINPCPGLTSYEWSGAERCAIMRGVRALQLLMHIQKVTQLNCTSRLHAQEYRIKHVTKIKITCLASAPLTSKRIKAWLRETNKNSMQLQCGIVRAKLHGSTIQNFTHSVTFQNQSSVTSFYSLPSCHKFRGQWIFIHLRATAIEYLWKSIGFGNAQSLAPQEGRHNECPPGLLGRKFIVVYLQVYFRLHLKRNSCYTLFWVDTYDRHEHFQPTC